MKVIVIGCGPSGLAAAHAAAGLGADIHIIGPKKQTPQRGPIMLHRPIPGINNDHPTGYVRQIVVGGSILDYRLKLYGDVNIAINGDILEPGFHTWPVPEAYDKMWEMYQDRIEDRFVHPRELPDLADSCDLVVTTAPANQLCWHPASHEFASVPIALVFNTVFPNQIDNTVIYNARSEDTWVRSSSIFGARVTEYKPEDCPDADLIIRKPLFTTCDCNPRILRTGRFGRWHNETWIDHAYYDTRTALVSIERSAEWQAIT
jgi:hypothetical protein